MSFNSLSQKFTISSSDSGANSQIEINQTGGNLLTALGFDIDGGGLSSASFKEADISGSLETAVLNSLKGKTMTISVNGTDAEIFVPTANTSGTSYDFVDDEDMTASGAQTAGEKFTAALNQALNTSAVKGEASFSYDKETGKISLKGTSSSDTVSLKSTGTDESDALVSALGFDAAKTNTNGLDAAAKAADIFGVTGSFSIGSTTITINDSTTLGDIKSAIEDAGVGTLNLQTGVITASEAVTSTDQSLAEKIFGTDYATLSNTANYPSGNATLSANGQNAIVTVNGVKISNASNSIDVDGTTVFLGNLSDTEAAAISSDNSIDIGVTRDTTSAFDAIVKFVDSYNTMISDLNTEISTKRPKSSGSYYDPLTEEQKEEMSDTEIENWEEQAKTGLLYQDSTIDNFLSKIRNALGTTTSDGFSLEDIGISESSSWQDNGKLVIDEEKLKSALSENSDKVMELFTDSSTGIGVTVENAVNSAISTSKSKGYGSLALLAGVENTSTSTSNSISTQIDSYQKIIDDLKERYEDELDRYWDRFTTLETYTSKYSSISSMFTSS